MAIIVTGADGYVGFPTTLKLAREFPDERIVAVDNFGRREWVEECGSVSAVPVKSPEDRFEEAKEEYSNISLVEGDLTDRDFVDQLLDTYEPETVIHLAAQPSAPYSQINGERACFTQYNNNEATRNLLWGIEESDLDSHFITSTTMGVYGAPEFPIPEGTLEVEHSGGEDEIPYPGMAGSWYHMCYDEETEVLTEDGWKEFSNLKDSDRVMALNPDSGEAQWERTSDIQSYDYDGEMRIVENRRIDLKVTPNHRMFVGASWAGDGRTTFEERQSIVRADELEGVNCFFTAFPEWRNENKNVFKLPECEFGVNQSKKAVLKEKEIEMESWLKFFGWWITEGSVGKDGQANNVRIYQDNPSGLEAVFADIGYDSYSTYPDSAGGYVEVTDKQLASYLRRFRDERFIPAWMRDLSSSQLEELLEVLIEADGTENHNGSVFYTSYKELADHVQEISLKAGYSAGVSKVNREDQNEWAEKEEYRVTISPSWCVQTNQEGDSYGFEEYSGKVYCCTVDSGIILVRRQGMPVWCGNSKSNDANNLRLAASQFDMDISDFRMGIVYGTKTQELEETGLDTRYDFDYYFGTVVNRFCAQAVSGYPITVYGKGEQRKPMIGLKDTVRSFVEAVDEGEGLKVYNQATRPVSIKELGETIEEKAQAEDFDTEVKHYENPRDEKEDHKMEVENDQFMELLGRQEQEIGEGVEDIISSLKPHRKRIKAHEDRFLPGVLTEEE